MSALRILVPVKRVIDYAVSAPPRWTNARARRLQSATLRTLRFRVMTGPGMANARARARARAPEHRSSRASTRRRPASRRPASSTA